MFRSRPYRYLFLAAILVPSLVYGQETQQDSLPQLFDTIEHAVYKPVISLSYGVLNFLGDVQNSQKTASIGDPGVMIGVSSFLGQKHNFVANFNYFQGQISGNSYSYSDISRNLNFKTSLSTIGVNVEYRFGHLFPKEALVRPYLSLGLETVVFSPKGDLKDASGNTYYYWSDGTIRDLEETGGASNLLYRDYGYETDLRLKEREEFGLGAYNQWALSIPVSAGFHFRIDKRAFFSLGVSYHHTLTDFLDNVAYEGSSIQGNKGNDSYLFTHLSVHFDLFSKPAVRQVDLLYADLDFDPLFFEDEDNDLVLDVFDHCPGTPADIAVDSAGCALDSDLDGVADYLDQEANTAPGAWVDDEGVTVTEEEFLSIIQQRNIAMPRDEVDAYMTLIVNNYRLASASEIPERYKPLDSNGDGYISFEELLKTIDKYFDFQLDLSLDELREVNEFFFSQ